MALLTILGVFCSVGINGAYASGTNNIPPVIENIQHDAVDACKDRQEGGGCMYIQNDTKITGTCQKHEGKLLCATIKQ